MTGFYRSDWSWVVAGFYLKGWVYVFGKYGICQVDPKTGRHIAKNMTDFSHTRDVTMIGNKAYAVTSTGCFEIDPENCCFFRELNKVDWAHAQALVAHKGTLYAFCSNGLWTINVETGVHKNVWNRNWSTIKRHCARMVNGTCYIHF